jgi:hypothetical protein
MAAQVLSDLTLGNYLKIVSKGAVYNNLSEDSPIWDLIKKKKKGKDEGRYMHYLLRSAYGSKAVGFVAPSGAYPSAHKSTTNEGKAQYKDFALTVEAERSVIARALSDMSRYGEPFAEEMRSKTIALSRILSAAVYQDGTGVIGTVSAISFPTSTTALVTLDVSNSARGHIGWFEFGDGVAFYDTSAVAATTTNAVTWTVSSRDRANNQVTLTASAAHNGAGGANAISAGDVIYRSQQATIPDLTALADYGVASEAFVGLGSLSQNDGRLVNGITLSGALGGTRRNCLGNPIDSQDFQIGMSNTMVAVGQGRYKYSKALMAWETLDALVESRETDRRFNSIQDNKRGVSELGYQHAKNSVIFQADEFCPKSKIYVCPEGDVLQFYGSDFETVKPDGGKGMHLKPNSSGYDRTMQLFMEGTGCLLSVHSPAILTIENFTI